MHVGSFDDVSGIYSAISDKRVKNDIEDLYSVLDKVLLLKAKKYHFLSQSEQDNKYIGFIAQEVLPLFPELVGYNEETDRYNLDYATFSIVAIKAIQEQQNELTELRQQVAELQSLQLSITSRLEALEDPRSENSIAGGKRE